MNTLNKDEAIRKAAEAVLNTACLVPGYIVSLLQTSVDVQFPNEVRQAAAISLKNAIRRNWNRSREDVPSSAASGKFTIPQEDCTVVRENVLAGLKLARSDNALRGVLSECVGLVAEYDYPERWPGFVPELIAQLREVNDKDCVLNALMALRRVVKRYEYKRRPRKAATQSGFGAAEEANPRIPLNMLVEATFPLLLEYGKIFVQSGEDDLTAAAMLRLIGKIFYSATRLELPPFLHNEQMLFEWFDLWNKCIAKPVRSLGEDDETTGPLPPWWKVRKCGLEICVRTFSECMKNPKFVSDNDSEAKRFTTFFIDGGVAVALLGTIYQLLSEFALSPTPWSIFPDRILQQCLSYCSIAMEPSKTYKCLKPNMYFLIDKVIFRCIEFSPRDQEMFDDEPEEVAAKDLDPLDDLFNVKATACQLLLDACRLRSKDVLDNTMTLIVNELNKRTSPGRQDAALLAIGALAEVVAPYTEESGTKKLTNRIQKYQNHLESMLISVIVPEMKAPEAHLRSRAVWVVGKYAHVEFKDPSICRATFGGLLERLGDDQLPVAAQAASSLKCVLVLDHDRLPFQSLKEIIVPHLAQVVEKYLVIMGKLGSDDVVGGLQALITAYQTEITPMACDICAALCKTYFQYTGQEEDEEGELACAAFETIEAINTLLDCVVDMPDMMQRMVPILTPFLQSIINPGGQSVQQDFMDYAITTLSYLTYYAPTPMPDALWAFIPQIKLIVEDVSSDYLADFVVVLQQFAYREPERFYLGGREFDPNQRTFMQQMLELCALVMDKSQEGEEEIRAAASLTSVLLQSAPKSDLIPVQAICNLATYWLFMQKDVDLSIMTRVRVFEIVETLFFIAPQETRNVFGRDLPLGLQSLRGLLQNHNTLRQKKIALLGLCRLLQVLVAEPAGNEQTVGLVLGMCAELLNNMENQRSFMERTKGQLAGGEGSEDGDDFDIEGGDNNGDDDEEYEEDDDAVDDEDEGFAAFFNSQQFDEDGELGEEDEEDDLLPWPLDVVSEVDEFGAALKNGFLANPLLMSTSLGNLDPSVKQAIVNFVPEMRFG